jgi:ankyrin repeat protein
MDAFLALRSESTGQTLLLTAAAEASVDCADRLIECGADVNAIGKLGYTPLLWCCDIGYPNHLVIAKRLFEEEDLDVRIIRCVRAYLHASFTLRR